MRAMLCLISYRLRRNSQRHSLTRQNPRHTLARQSLPFLISSPDGQQQASFLSLMTRYDIDTEDVSPLPLFQSATQRWHHQSDEDCL